MKLRRALATAGVFALIPTFLVVPAGHAATPPNFLIVVTDDQPIGTEIAIPNVEAWMTSIFTQAYVTTPQCCPSRSSILTGKLAHNHGVDINKLTRKLDLSETVVEELQGAGYRTGMAGKYLNRWGGRRPRSFDRWAISVDDVAYANSEFVEQGQKKTVKYGPKFVFDFGRKTLKLWEERADQDPWLLMLTPSSPHNPFDPQGAFARAGFPPAAIPAEDDRSDKPPYVRRSDVSTTRGARVRKAQLRSLLTVNEQFERIMQRLDTYDELDNTYVFFISDNGFLWGQHGLERKAHAYLPAVRVPMYMRDPNALTAVEDDRLVANTDIAPTMFELAGVTPTYPVDGRSLLGSHVRTELLLEHEREGGGVPPWRSIVDRFGQYTYYLNDGFEEFYDLTTDPDEHENIAPPQRYVDLLAQYEDCVGTFCP